MARILVLAAAVVFIVGFAFLTYRAFAEQGVTLEDAFDLTPELKAEAQAEIKKYRIGPSAVAIANATRGFLPAAADPEAYSVFCVMRVI